MKFKANLDLYNLILALAGTDKFTTTEQTHIKAFANRRFHEAYKASDVWPRYVRVGEPRSIDSSLVPFEEDGFYAFGAGTDAANGLYKLNGTENSAAAYTKYEGDGTTEEYSLIYSGTGTTWNIIAGAPDSGGAVQYYNSTATNTVTTSSPTISQTGWEITSGTTPAPQVKDLADIEEIIKIHRNQPYLKVSGGEYDFYTDIDGIHVINLETDDPNIVYLTYKITFTEITDLDENTDSALEEIPLEYFYYIAHAVYADFLRMDSQTEKAQIEEQLAKTFLAPEIERAEQLMNANMLKTRIHTHVSRQHRR